MVYCKLVDFTVCELYLHFLKKEKQAAATPLPPFHTLSSSTCDLGPTVAGLLRLPPPTHPCTTFWGCSEGLAEDSPVNRELSSTFYAPFSGLCASDSPFYLRGQDLLGSVRTGQMASGWGRGCQNHTVGMHGLCDQTRAISNPDPTA